MVYHTHCYTQNTHKNITEKNMSSNVKAAYKHFDPEEDFPDLSKHNNWMAKCLTKDIYKKLRDKQHQTGLL